MKIAVVTYRFPYPPDRGDRLSMYTLLRLFSQRHQVTLFSFVDGTEPPEARERISAFCERIETVHLGKARSWLQAWLGLFGRVPSQVAYFRSAAMNARVRQALAAERFDVVFVHAFRVAPCVEGVRHPGIVMWLGDSVGMVLKRAAGYAPWWRRPGLLWEAARADSYAVECSRRATESWVLSPVDQADLERHGAVRLVLLPHGVDDALYSLPRAIASPAEIVFLGNLSVPHNVDAACYAAREVWPLVHARHADAKLRLVGADPVPAVQALGALPGVEITGPLPDLRDMWSRAQVMLAPLRFSAGIQNKLLEAIAAGVPVVTSPGAAGGIGARHGEHVLVATTEREYADAVESVLAQPAEAAARAARAREHVRREFSWERLVRRLEQVGAAGSEAAIAEAADAREGT